MTFLFNFRPNILVFNRAITNQEVGYLDIFRSEYLKTKTSKKVIYQELWNQMPISFFDVK